MKKNQKPNRIYKSLIVLGVLGIIGISCWFFLRPNTDTATNNYVAECSASIPEHNNAPTEPPYAWALYEIRDIGVKYFYPLTWGSPTIVTNSGTQNYEADHTIQPSDAFVAVLLSQDCSGFPAAISDIKNGKFDTQDGQTTTKAINHDKSSYSSMSHWTSSNGNQYKFTIYNVVNVGVIKSIAVSYTVITGEDTCPDNSLASDAQSKCINQSISDEINGVVSSLQKYTPETN